MIFCQAMWGAPAPPPREATPPPPVERLPGYLEVAPDNFFSFCDSMNVFTVQEPVKVVQVDKLVYGSGATRDAGLVFITHCQGFINWFSSGEFWALVYPSYLLCKGLFCREQKSMQWRYDNGRRLLLNLIIILLPQVSIKLVLMKQTMAHQQQQTKYLQRQQAVSIMSR